LEDDEENWNKFPQQSKYLIEKEGNKLTNLLKNLDTQIAEKKEQNPVAYNSFINKKSIRFALRPVKGHRMKYPCATKMPAVKFLTKLFNMEEG
jgi:hypothetical protein